MPLVSIIIPAYNAEPWIKVALDSALAQTLDDLEIIVIDDGSRDGSTEAVGQYTDGRVRLISQENQGQSAANNRGVQEARGSYIKFLDADDWLAPEHLEQQLNALDGHTDRIADCSWAYFVDRPDGLTARKESTNQSFDDPIEWLMDSLINNEGMMGGWKWLIPREVLHRAGQWNPALSLNNDFDFSIRVLLASRGTCFAPEALYGYRKTENSSLSGSSGRKAMESAWLTTDLGTKAILDREDSNRTRKVCADRFQMWLYQFYPEFPDLSRQAEGRIAELGGSSRPMEGGRLLQTLLPVIGWKGVRKLQTFAYKSGWAKILAKKQKRRIQAIAKQTPTH
ncbi:MAG: glycosyltransferase family 2 protein [Verrucomicrobiota bacterium]